MKYMEDPSLYRLLKLKISKGVMSPLNQSMMSLEVKQITKKNNEKKYMAEFITTFFVMLISRRLCLSS